MATLADIYQKELDKIDRQYDRLERMAIADILSDTRQLSKDAIVAISDIDFKSNDGLRQAQRSVNQAILRYEQAIADRMQALFADISLLGISSVADPLLAIGEPGGEPQNVEPLALAAATAVIVAAGIVSKVRQTIETNLRLGFLGGLSIRELSRKIRRGIARSAADIKRTIRTESTRMFNMAHSVQQKAANAIRKDKLLKGWLTVGDNRVRPTHRAAGRARPIPVNQLFIVGGDKLRYPGDPRGSTGETINCRCRMYTVPKKVLKNEKSKQAA